MHFEEVWFVDFEFTADPGERPVPLCLVAQELYSGRTLRLWQDDITALHNPPYPIGHHSVVIAYYASAEMGCHLALGWPLPQHVLDLYVEFKNLSNGKQLPCGGGLLGALQYFGLNGISAVEKDNMHTLALRGGLYTAAERQALIDYCETDVIALSRLYPRMAPKIDWPRAMLRGRYMKAAAHMEHNGVPVDTYSLEILRKQWQSIQDQLIASVDKEYGVYEGRTFRLEKFEMYLSGQNIPWPRYASGRLDLTDDTFKEMARIYPQLGPLRELRVALSQMRLSDLAVGRDSRNRAVLSAFNARTSRNQPSNARFIFGPATWLRGLIMPQPGYGLAYVDWAQQEFGIAAALSGDRKMIEAYTSGDPYLEFAKQAGAVPPSATKQSHASEREQFKACVLAVQYGMGKKSLAIRINQPVAKARELLHLHRTTYQQFWQWSDSVENYAMIYGKLYTVFGWTIHLNSKPNPRSIRNFPMQANGAEMLRLACCFVTERGIPICAPVHDAILIEAPLDTLEQTVAYTQELMAQASAIVLDGFRLRSEAKLICYPDRYIDPRGRKMWDTVWNIIEPCTARSG